MNARLVRKRIGPDHRLVGRGLEGDQLAEHFAGGIKLIELDAGRDAVAVAAHVERCGNLFESGVAGTLADAVDSALHLARAGLDGGQRIRHCKAKIVVAMR